MTEQTKPFAELYGPGKPGANVDPQSDHYVPLFMSIERAVVHFFVENPALTDGSVSLTLDLLGRSPEAEFRNDPLAQRVQAALRVTLGSGDYSRDEVRQALRKIRKSVDRHTRNDGTQGYLNFIQRYVPV